MTALLPCAYKENRHLSCFEWSTEDRFTLVENNLSEKSSDFSKVTQKYFAFLTVKSVLDERTSGLKL